jgi:hypothetical protein
VPVSTSTVTGIYRHVDSRGKGSFVKIDWLRQGLGFQLRMIVIGGGVAASAAWLMRNRPSRETAYSVLLSAVLPVTVDAGKKHHWTAGRECRALVGDGCRHQLAVGRYEVELLTVSLGLPRSAESLIIRGLCVA